MKKNFNILKVSLIILIMMSGFVMVAQKNASKGDRYFDKNLFTEAIKYYRIEAKNGDRYSSLYAKQQLAKCYRILGEFEMAENMYRKILKSKKNRLDPSNFLNYGKSLKSSAKYAEAKIQFKEYIKLNPGDPMGEIFLYSCDSAQNWLEETIGKEVKNLESINTEASDFSPVILNQSKLVFTSSREGSKEALISFDGGMKVQRLDIYSANIYELTGETKIDVVSIPNINSPLHEGSATFSADGTEMYFTRTIKGKKTKKTKKTTTNEVVSTLQIFYSKIDSLGEWSEPVSAFVFNSLDYSIGQPALSYDGETLFFMSDMKGGYGGTDIYFTEKREDGTWIEPINAGSEVNTFGYELFPYISEKGILYFSSDTHIGMGKLDIFSSTKHQNEWGNVKNLKPPYNSIGNDFGIVFDKKAARGFFSSDRFNGMGAEDIYSFSEEIAPLVIEIDGVKLKLVDNTIYDGLKYVLKNKTTKKDTTLVAEDGFFTFQLTPNNDYELQVKKNRFSVYNKLEFKVSLEDQKNYSTTTIKALTEPFFFKGDLSVLDPDDTNHVDRIALVNQQVQLLDSNINDLVRTDNYGAYIFKNKLSENVNYQIVASKKVVPELVKVIKVENAMDSILVKGEVLDNALLAVEAKITIRKEGLVFKEVKTTADGHFSIVLPTEFSYEIMAAAKGFYPGLKSINPQDFLNKKTFNLKVKLNKVD